MASETQTKKKNKQGASASTALNSNWANFSKNLGLKKPFKKREDKVKKLGSNVTESCTLLSDEKVSTVLSVPSKPVVSSKRKREEDGEVTTLDDFPGHSNKKEDTQSNLKNVEYLSKLLLGNNSANDNKTKKAGKIFGMHCVIVNCGKGGKKTAPAQVTLVNYFGQVMFDSYVQINTTVVGLTPVKLCEAPPLPEIHKKVSELIKGKVLVGHNLKIQLEALGITHPADLLRDTGSYFPFLEANEFQPLLLPKLVKDHIGYDFAVDSPFDSIDHALAALALYRKFKPNWDSNIYMKFHHKNNKSKTTQLKK